MFDTRKEAVKIATEMMGQFAQSSILTMISERGNKVCEPMQKITGYEIVEFLDGYELFLVLGGESVLWDTCFNFSWK